MISQRTQGLQYTHVFCQALLALALFTGCACVVFPSWSAASEVHLQHYAVYGALIVAGLVVEGLRRKRTPLRLDLLQRNFSGHHGVALRQVAYALGVLLCFLALAKDQFISRGFLLAYCPVLYLGLLISNRYLPPVLARRVFRGIRGERTLLVGSPTGAVRLEAWARSKEAVGIKVVGLLSQVGPRGGSVAGFCCLGRPEEIEEVIRREAVTQVILLELPEQPTTHRKMVACLEQLGVRLLIQSDLETRLQHPVVYLEDDGLQFITLRQEPLENPFNRLLKRVLDVAVALPVVVLVLPPLTLFVWLAQRAQSPGPIFYRQRRAGIQNREFLIWKFRSMHTGGFDETRPAARDDARVFPLGGWLRRMSLDEMPQFLNVLGGEMSVTGPRPHLIEHHAQFAREMANYQVRSIVKPGITGLAQVRGLRGEAHTPEQIGQRLASDISYLENWRLALDLAIIARTAWQIVLPPRNAY